MKEKQNITLEDLKQFKEDLKTELLAEIQAMFSHQEPEPKQWLKTHQVLRRLGISETTLHNYRKKGLINPKKIGGTNFYDTKEIESLLP